MSGDLRRERPRLRRCPRRFLQSSLVDEKGRDESRDNVAHPRLALTRHIDRRFQFGGSIDSLREEEPETGRAQAHGKSG